MNPKDRKSTLPYEGGGRWYGINRRYQMSPQLQPQW